jgi:uncharacterized membrane protein
MDSSSLALYTLIRVLHVGTAIVLVGGSFFIRFILMPAANRQLADDVHARLRGDILAAWKWVVHGGITLLILSGGINYFRVIAEGSHKGDGLYHGLLGTKILLAMAIFFIASVLVGRATKFEAMRANTRRWLAVNLVLALLIVAISGFLKVRGVPEGRAMSAAATDFEGAPVAEAPRQPQAVPLD